MYPSEELPSFSNKRDFEIFIAGDEKKAKDFVNNLYNNKTQISKGTVSGKKVKLADSLSSNTLTTQTKSIFAKPNLQRVSSEINIKSKQFQHLDDKSIIKTAEEILNKSHQSLLSEPIAQRDENKVQFLMHHGANLTLRSPDGKSPLLKIVLDKTHDDEMGAFLIKKGCLSGTNPSKLGDQFRKAISCNLQETLQELINFGVNPNISGKAGLTPLMFIALSGMDEDKAKETIGILIKNGADINRTDDNGATALIRAAKESTNMAVIKMLSDVDHCDINAVDGRGLNALHYCFSTMSGLDAEDRIAILEHLIEKSGQMASFIEDLPLSNENRAVLMKLVVTEPQKLAQPEHQEIIAEAIDRKLLLRVRGLTEQPLEKPMLEECKRFRENYPRIIDMAAIEQNDPDKYREFMNARACKSTSLENAGDGDDSKKKWIEGEERVREMALNKEPMTTETICALNALVNTEEECNPGVPRSDGVEVCIPGVDAGLVPGKYVTEELDRFVKWLNESLEHCDKSKLDPINVASNALQRLVSIHPFGDGNGRTSRYMMDYVLQRYGLPPAAMSNVNVIVFSMRTKNVTPEETVNLVMEGIRNSYNMLGLKTEE